MCTLSLLRLGAVSAVLLLGLNTVGWAQESIGKAVKVVQATNVVGTAGEGTTLRVDEPVFSGDRIATDATGEAQIEFLDSTRLVVGPNSSMIIDAFVYAGDGSTQVAALNVVRGAFRFITGGGSKDVYKIITPTATIGFRGSALDLTIEDDGTTFIAQLEGETEVCRRDDEPRVGAQEDDDDRCAAVASGCSIWTIGAGQDPEEIEDTAEKNLAVLRRFRYVRDQEDLLAGFSLDVSACGHFADKGNLGNLIPLLIPPAIIPLLPISP